jgi:hypothetical protein
MRRDDTTMNRTTPSRIDNTTTHHAKSVAAIRRLTAKQNLASRLRASRSVPARPTEYRLVLKDIGSSLVLY